MKTIAVVLAELAGEAVMAPVAAADPLVSAVREASAVAAAQVMVDDDAGPVAMCDVGAFEVQP